MSIEALNWALEVGERDGLEPTPRHVLLVLANRADEHGYVFPSVKWIQRRTGYASSTVRDHLKAMSERTPPLITKEARNREDGGQSSNLYRLALNQPGFSFNAPRADGRQGGADWRKEGGRHPEGVPPARGTLKTKEETKEQTKGERAARASRLPASFAISEEVRLWARSKGWEQFLPAYLETFKRKCEARGAKYANWDRAFENCIADDWGDIRRAAERKGGSPLTSIAKKRCRYCPKESTGNYEGIEHCDGHYDNAMNREPAPKVLVPA